MKLGLIIVFIISVLLMSCKHKIEQSDDNNLNLINISKVQFESENMMLGMPELHQFADKVHFTGVIVPSVNGKAKISLPLPGKINKILCKANKFIKKGSTLFEISGNMFIDMQKDFAESSAILSKLKSDYIRTEKLYNQNVGAKKDFIAAESKFKAENAKNIALKTKLENLGLNVEKIKRGVYYSIYSVTSPISGFVSGVDVSLGQYAEPQQIIAEVIDNNLFHLKLSVFEKEIGKIKVGQILKFYLNGDRSIKYKAKINSVGKTILPENKSIECFAVIQNLKNINLINNQFVEGEVYTSVDSVLSVPESAIVEAENEKYVLMYQKQDSSMYYFKKMKVNLGRKSDKYIELKEQLPSKKILVRGTYNIVID